MLHFAGADTVGQGAKGAMGGRMGIPAHHRHAGQRGAVFRADQVVHRYFNLVEMDRRGIAGVPAHLGQRSAGNAGTVEIHQQQRDTAKAWIERYYTQQMRELVLRQMQETRLQAQTVESGFGVGRNSQADVFAARAALVMLEDRLSQLDKQERNAALMLARWVGPAAERPVAGAPAWQTSRLDDGRLDEHIQYHPDLVMLKAQVEAAQTEARLADANKKADWSVEAMYSQRGSAYSNMISLGVSVPLQWDQKNRQDRELAAKLAMVDEARAKYEEMLRNHDAEVRSLLNDWKNGKSRVVRYRDELIPLARQRSEASLTSAT